MRRALLVGLIGSVALLACNALLGIRDDVVFDANAEGGPGGGPGGGGPGPDGSSGEGGAGDSGGPSRGDGGPSGPPPACAPDLPRDTIAEIGTIAELYTVVIAGDLLYAAGYADGTNGGVFRVRKDGSGAPEQIVQMPKVFGLVVVGDKLYFSSTEKPADGTLHGGVYSCDIKATGLCIPKPVFKAYEPAWIEYDGTWFYIADGNQPTRFRVDASGAVPATGGVERTENAGPASFVVDHGALYDLETDFGGPGPQADFITSEVFDAGAGGFKLWDTGNDGAFMAGADQLAQSENYVFWGAYDRRESTNSGGIVRRDPKRNKAGSICAYGGAPRPNTTPFALVASSDTLYWTNPAPMGAGVECCPIEGPCCVPLGADAAAPSTQPITLKLDDQTPSGLAIDGTGIYYVAHEPGIIYRLRAP